MQKISFINFKIRGFNKYEEDGDLDKTAAKENKTQLVLKALTGDYDTAGEEESNPKVEFIGEVEQLPGSFRKILVEKEKVKEVSDSRREQQK